jgi:hypothetical protein
MEKGPPTTVLDVCEMHRVGRICTYHGMFRFPAGCRFSTGLRDRGIDDFRITVTACEYFRFNAYRVFF